LHLRIPCECPECGEAYYLEMVQIVDFGEEPELRKRLLQGEINLAVCPYCGSDFLMDSPFLVNDPKYRRIIFFIPPTPGKMNAVEMQLLRNSLHVAFKHKKPYFETPVVVSDWDQLVRLIDEGVGD